MSKQRLFLVPCEGKGYSVLFACRRRRLKTTRSVIFSQLWELNANGGDTTPSVLGVNKTKQTQRFQSNALATSAKVDNLWEHVLTFLLLFN